MRASAGHLGYLGCWLAILATGAVSTACSPESTTSVSVVPEPAARGEAAPAEGSFALSGFPILGLEGWSYQVRVEDVSGIPMSGRTVSWESSDSSVVRIGPSASIDSPDPSLTVLSAVAVGSAVVSVTVDGRRLSVPWKGIQDPPVSTALAVDAFSVIEFAYGSSHPYYAPQLRLGAPETSGDIEMWGAQFDLPGLGVYQCTTSRILKSGSSSLLNREYYGDFALTFDLPEGRASARVAGIVVYFVDGQGRPGKVSLDAVPIVAGSLPDTYTGGPVSDTWSCSGLVASGPDPA